MEVQGKWHSEGSAAQYKATLRSSNGLFTIETDQGNSFTGKLEEIIVSDRLGNVERTLTLEDGSIFATGDNSAIDELFRKRGSVNRFIHAIESHMGWVAFALVATILFTFVFFKWGVPLSSAWAAHALPQKTNELIGEGSLDYLDKYLFDESKLDPEKMEELRAHFNASLIPLQQNPEAINYRLHFRRWSYGEMEIPNALALPSGDIVLTDKFVELAKNQNEIDAVLLHEMGHVVNRHALEMVIEGAIVTTVVMLVTGDNSGIVDMGVGIGSLLIASNYSRAHESEADLYAFEKMLTAKIDPQSFADIIQRMTAYVQKADGNAEDEPPQTKDDNKNLLDYLSSHPNTTERIERARQYSECYLRGLATCSDG